MTETSLHLCWLRRLLLTLSSKMNMAVQSEPWKAMPAHHLLIAEVIIQRESDLQREGVLSRFYACFIVLQVKLNLVIMSSVSKTVCNRRNMKDRVKYCWVIAQAWVCLLAERRKGLSVFPENPELPGRCCYIKDAFLSERLLLMRRLKNHLSPSSRCRKHSLPDFITGLQIQPLFCVFTLQRCSSVHGVGKTEQKRWVKHS